MNRIGGFSDTGVARRRAGGLGFRMSGILLAAALAVTLLVPAPAHAGQIRITIRGALTFPDQDPDAVPVIGPQPVSIKVQATGRPGRFWTVTLIGDDDLRSGPAVIPIDTVSWIASPQPPMNDGTLSLVTPVLVASGSTPSAINANFDFFLQNSWDYNVGNYTSTATFTVAAP